jgi:hypothetical protein
MSEIERGRRLCKKIVEQAKSGAIEKRHAQRLALAYLDLARKFHDQRVRHRAEIAMIKSEIRREFVSYEATSARVDERQRQLFERATAQKNALESYTRGRALAAYVDASLASLAPQSNGPARDCARIVESRQPQSP